MAGKSGDGGAMGWQGETHGSNGRYCNPRDGRVREANANKEEDQAGERPKKRQIRILQVVVAAAAAAAEEAAQPTRKRINLPLERCVKLQKKRAYDEKGSFKFGQISEEEVESVCREQFLPLLLILDWLSVHQIFQLRCVSKLWNSMLVALPDLPFPLDLKTEGEEYWFIMAGRRKRFKKTWDFLAYRSTDWACFRPPLPSSSHGKLAALLGGVGCSLLHQSERDLPHIPCMISAGGLMCALVQKPGSADDYDVLVFNCLSGSVKVLPAPLDSQRLFRRPLQGFPNKLTDCIVKLAADDQDPSRYYVMLTHLDPFLPSLERSRDFYFEIYDSKRGCWRVGQPLTSATANYKLVSQGDFFHYLVTFQSLTVLAYHAKGDLWSKASIPTPAGAGVSPVFHKHKGKLLRCCPWTSDMDDDEDGLSRASDTDDDEDGLSRVSDMEDAKDGLSRGLHVGFVVWELQLSSSGAAAAWVEVARTPEPLWQQLFCNDWNAKIRAEGSLICMAFSEHDKQGQFRPPLVYDIAHNRWFVLPLESSSTNFGCIMVHRPKQSLCAPHL